MVAALAGAAPSATSGLPPPNHPARARLVAEQGALVPGHTGYLGLSFDIDPGWHLYWHGASDTGMPIMVELDLPRGVKAGPTLWPAPMRHVSEGDILDYIYEKRVTLIIPVTLAEGTDAKAAGKLTINAKVSWMVCKSLCLTDNADLSITLPIETDPARAAPTADSPLLAEARKSIPQPPENAAQRVKTQWDGRILHIVSEGAAGLAFFPDRDSAAMTSPIKQGERKSDTLSIEFEPSALRKQASGVLEVRPPDGKPSEYFTLIVPTVGTNQSDSRPPRPQPRPKG
jgi:DsbC/DsbD-like thiol-disulfide interchange protein